MLESMWNTAFPVYDVIINNNPFAETFMILKELDIETIQSYLTF